MADLPKVVRGPWGPPYGSIMADLAEHAYSAHKLGLRHGWTREETSRLLQNLRRRGYVEHRGAWGITDAGRAAIADAAYDGIASARPLGIGQREEGGCRDA